MRCVVISYFDNIDGPRPLLNVPEILDEMELNNIASLIDKTFEFGFFIYEFTDYTSANYFFEIESDWARGNKEMVLLSIIVSKDFDYKAINIKALMEDFIKELNENKNVFKAFHIFDNNRRNDPEIEYYFEKLKNCVNDLNDSLPKETVALNNSQIKIFVFGLDRAGKSTILNRVKTDLFVKVSPTINLNIMNLIIGNMQLTCFDVSGQKRFRHTWKRFIVSSQYLIFVIDVNKPERYEEAKTELWNVLNYEEGQGVPLLILVNKIDLSKKVDLDYFIKFLELNKIKNRKWHIIETSALYNQGIKEAFEYITKDLLSNQLTMISNQ
ncbi:MAG: ADP-ribosylation factor family protein [Candidatus Helarchaeota archaeon]